jgi:hypothetical protein
MLTQLWFATRYVQLFHLRKWLELLSPKCPHLHFTPETVILTIYHRLDRKANHPASYQTSSHLTNPDAKLQSTISHKLRLGKYHSLKCADATDSTMSVLVIFLIRHIVAGLPSLSLGLIVYEDPHHEIGKRRC